MAKMCIENGKTQRIIDDLKIESDAKCQSPNSSLEVSEVMGGAPSHHPLDRRFHEFLPSSELVIVLRPEQRSSECGSDGDPSDHGKIVGKNEDFQRDQPA